MRSGETGSRPFSWMLSGWIASVPLLYDNGGTEFVTISVPDDFVAVRVGLANIKTEPWHVEKIIACASSRRGDFFNPVDLLGCPRPADSWVTLPPSNADDSLGDLADATSHRLRIAPLLGTDEEIRSGNPAWTFTKWTPCQSLGADPLTGMRVLMLRALIRGNQLPTYTNGTMEGYSSEPQINHGFETFLGGVKYNADMVTDPMQSLKVELSQQVLQVNRLVNGQIMCLIQVETRHNGVVGMIAGDSHQAGTSSTAQISSFLLRGVTSLGQSAMGHVPYGIVSTATGGATSDQIFPRMITLLDEIRPSFVVMPGWSYNEKDGLVRANEVAEKRLFDAMLEAAHQVRSRGSIPIVLTPFPIDPANMNEEVHSVWLDHRRKILTLRQSGMYVLDASKVLGASTNGELTGTYKFGLSDDMLHPNDAGHEVLSNVLKPLIREIAGKLEF